MRSRQFRRRHLPCLRAVVAGGRHPRLSRSAAERRRRTAESRRVNLRLRACAADDPSLWYALPVPDELDPSGEDVDYVRKRSLILKEHADAVLEVKNRAVSVYGEMVLGEIEYLVICGWDQE